MTDTTPEVMQHYRAMLLARSPEERLKMGCSMSATARALVRASVLAHDPHASPAALRRALFLRFYGHEFEAEDAGEDPGVAGAGRVDGGLITETGFRELRCPRDGADHEPRRVELAKAIVRGKLGNQAALLNTIFPDEEGTETEISVEV